MHIGFIFGKKPNNCLPEDPPSYDLTGYIDINFVEDLEEHKLVIDYYFFLNGAIVSWNNKKQRTISI